MEEVIQSDSPITEVLPKRGLLFQEKPGYFEGLCKPKLMPIKSATLEKMEQLARASATAVTAPLPADKTDVPGFSSTIPEREAEGMLVRSTPGSYVVRPSNQFGFLAVMYLNPGPVVAVDKLLVGHTKDGSQFWFEDQASMLFPTLAQLLSSRPDKLLSPLAL